jgi:hypothetical protein
MLLLSKLQLLLDYPNYKSSQPSSQSTESISPEYMNLAQLQKMTLEQPNSGA